MRPDIAAETQDWLWRAERDLQAAHQMLSSLPVLGDMAAFHAQQAAEKALKGYLTAQGRTFPKSHLLQPLLEECVQIDPRFQQFQAAARALSPYAIEFRYPGGRRTPSDREALEAREHATSILAFVHEATSEMN
jgi:HEPN domain-containing protein